MTRVLRHLAVRIWLLLLWGLPLGLWLLPGMLIWVPGLSPAVAMALFLVAGGMVQGGILDFAGRQRVLGLIREGELWEQAGVRPRAEEQFVKAVRIFDSALVSVWTGRRVSVALSRAMAGFYLTGPTRYPGFRSAAARYLLHRPEDETLALLWAERYLAEFREVPADSLTRSVLAALAEAHHTHPGIAQMLVVPFIEQGRKDLPAKRLYQSVLRMMETEAESISPACNPHIQNATVKEKIEALLAEETLAGPVPGMAPDLDVSQSGQETENFLGDSEAISKGPTLGEQLGPREFSKTVVPYLQSAGRRGSRATARILGQSADMAGAAAAGLGRGMTRGVGFAGAGAGKLARILGREAGRKGALQKGMKAVLISALAVWLGVFLWSSLAHMLKSTSTEPVPHPVSDPVPTPVDRPFTIQVAAYLKQAHAERYVQALKEKGVVAQVKKTLGGGKTWYLVRVSTFGTQEAAAEYGRQLKAEGKIQEFFVSNT